jgi:hypothetical protein
LAILKATNWFLKGKEYGVCKEFDRIHPVTAVFASNCMAFRLESNNVTIGHNDVDWEGKLKMSLPDNTVLNPQKNFELRLLFF